jgi:hypothetical protein
MKIYKQKVYLLIAFEIYIFITMYNVLVFKIALSCFEQFLMRFFYLQTNSTYMIFTN